MNNTLNGYIFISGFIRNKGRKIVDRFAYKNGEYYYVQTEGNTIKRTAKLYELINKWLLKNLNKW